ncbi:hypothetical protein BKA65DRAFT_553880 [Rhexocercosporidium sp. MPI-PUGE-AT-0058]|nr:hypothetical protein BKA65DRAFT_553880 [Rhexocercosporidium sp. MPI-PUGE-AT-0058]
MAIAPHILNLCLLAVLASAYDGTTTYNSILVAHTAAPYCPTPIIGAAWNVDENYIACCETWANGYSMTLTTATGFGKQLVYACCLSAYTCSGAPQPMSDWTLDSHTDVQALTLVSTPALNIASPTQAPTTSKAIRTSTGTFSAPGATPIATSAGTVIYEITNIGGDSNVQNGGTGNIQSIGVKNGALSVSEKAGIATGVIGAVLTAAGVWYARKSYLEKRKKKSGQIAPNGQENSLTTGGGVRQVYGYQPHELASSSRA